MAALPMVTVPAQTSTLLGETVNMSLVFDNTGATTGYGPYIDLFVPIRGVDGAVGGAKDGIVANSLTANYLGSPLQMTTLTFDATGHATHPFAKDAVGAPLIVSAPLGFGASDQLVVLVLPFGSFTASQPAATIQVTAQLSNFADINAPLPIEARAGFRYGNDALDNQATDPNIIQATDSTGTITPELFRLTKTYIGPEDETATGPNYVRQYKLTLDVATGQTLTNVDLMDLLPANMQFVSLDSITTATGSPTISTPGTNPVTTSQAGGTLARRFSSVTGTAGTNDATLTFSYYTAVTRFFP